MNSSQTFVKPYSLSLELWETIKRAANILAPDQKPLCKKTLLTPRFICRHCTWTSSYYDDFATLPCLLPPGPIGLYGLGAGTAAHLLHHVAPERRVHAWELDGKVSNVETHFGVPALCFLKFSSCLVRSWRLAYKKGGQSKHLAPKKVRTDRV